MKRVILSALTLSLVLAVMAGPAQAQRLTFYKDVLPILQENCQTCHRPSGLNLSGMVAPMSLITYDEVRPWAKSMARVVADKEMPPWHASEEFNGTFRNERTLTNKEIDTLVNWVKARAPKGNPTDAPPPIEWPESGWNAGAPDLIVDFDEPFFVPDDAEDLYQNITVTLTDEQLSEDRWIKSIEFRPGSEVVHHIIGYAVSKGSADGASGRGGRETRGMLGGNAPGTDQAEFPEGYGILLKKNSEITFAMHYHKEGGPGTGVFDSSQLGIQFHTEAVTHPIDIHPIAYRNFEIPPYHPKWRVGAAETFKEDTMILSLMPHMHLRGYAAKYTAFYPDGKSEVLLDVPVYDFNWQTGYGYDEPRVLPAGTRLEMELWFTNTEERAAITGINPGRSVRFGGPTTDEMDLAWITVAPAEPIEPGSAGGDD